MQFYRITGLEEKEDQKEEERGRAAENRRRQEIFSRTEAFNRDLDNTAFICAADVDDGFARLVALVRKPLDLSSLAARYLEAVGLSLSQIEVREISMHDASGLLSAADRRDYIYDDDDILRQFELEDLDNYRCGVEFDENVLEPAEPAKVYEKARAACSDRTLLPELNRIYKGGTAQVASGHPVHYLIETDDPDVRKAVYRPLLQALYAQGRIRSLRYVFTDMRASGRVSKKSLDRLYKSCVGGTVVIRYYANDEAEGEQASADRDLIETLSECIKKYRNQVLTVLCLPRVCDKTKSFFLDYLGSVSLMELQEDFAAGNKARAYLRGKALEAGTKADRKLYALLAPEQAYLASDLNRMFDEWYNDKLRRSIYPQYKSCAAAVAGAAEQKAPKGAAAEELEAMIGLDSAKRVIAEALAYYKAQRLFAEKGMKQERAAMHMVFTGNPGTAKTTVARLFARIMRDNGLLSKGQLVEVGRSDLVGKFVGWTAPTVKKKFKEAQGGVLFIDEAYALVDDRDGLYGDEAINTIVQEMENHREDTVVIFAGYPDKMQGFLDKNPGLRSRIAFHVPFEDYTVDDLCAITRLMAGRKQLELTADAQEKLAGIYDSVREQKDFGNGRFVRNLLEKAQMAQARRLLDMDPAAVTEREVRTIEAADVEEPPMNRQRDEKRKIGF